MVGDLDSGAGRRKEDGNSTASAPSFLNACRKGHVGRTCGTCDVGWTMAGTTCRYCGSTGTSSRFFVGSLIVLSVALVLFAYFGAWRPLVQEDEERLLGMCFPRADDYDTEEMSRWERFKAEVGEGAVTDWLKALISFFQVSGNFVLKVNVVWPQALLDFLLTMAAAFQLDIFSFPGDSPTITRLDEDCLHSYCFSLARV